MAERGGRNRTEALEAPFVGRQEELRLLKDLFHATGREKRLRVVSVIGPAGIGKSRLAWEFSKYIDGLIEDVYWHRGRSPAYGEGITFWALGEMVRERAGLRETDDEATTRAKVKETVAQWVTDAEEIEWIERALLTLLGVEGGMAADQLFGAWRTFFERIAEKGTVALVFEDMHFADAGLLDFVDHLLEFSRGLPIYVVTLARPELIERRPDWGAGKRNFVSLYLEPLPEADMRALLAGPRPGPARDCGREHRRPRRRHPAVRGRDGAHPGRRGQAGRGSRHLRPEGRPDHARRSRHSHGAHRVAARYARRGRSADRPRRRGARPELHPCGPGRGRRRSRGRPRPAARSASSGASFCDARWTPRSPERGQYAFVQALIREVAYNTLSRKDRKKLHLAAARYFESLGNDEIAGALASHYLAAQANAAEGAEAGALAGQARIALRAAATRASKLGSFDQAASFLEQALSVTTEPAEQVELLLQQAEALRTAGHSDDAEASARRALQLAGETGDRLAQARATALLGVLLSFNFRIDEGLALLEPAVVEYADVDEDVVAQLKLSIARCAWMNGDNRRALEMCESVLEVAERLGLIETIAFTLITKGNALFALGRRREAIGIARLARDLSAEEGLVGTQLRAMGNLSGSMSDFDLNASIDGYKETITLARKTGQRSMVISSVGNLGYSGIPGGRVGPGAGRDGRLAHGEHVTP